MSWCHLRLSEQKRNVYDSIIIEYMQVHDSSNCFLAHIRKCMYLPPCDSANSFRVVATRKQYFFQLSEYVSPLTPAVFHLLRKWIVPTKRIVAVNLLTHDDDLL